MILIIALISFVPFGIAWYLAQHPELVRERQRLNRGNLIDPAQPQDYADFVKQPLTPVATMEEIRGRWVMVQVNGGAACSDVCREAAYKTGQIQLMLNKEIARVRRLLLMPAPADNASLTGMATADGTLLIGAMDVSLRRKLEQAVGSPLTDGMLILMDPFANVMMWYPSGFDPYDVLKDLQRLLRISQIG